MTDRNKYDPGTSKSVSFEAEIVRLENPTDEEVLANVADGDDADAILAAKPKGQNTLAVTKPRLRLDDMLLSAEATSVLIQLLRAQTKPCTIKRCNCREIMRKYKDFCDRWGKPGLEIKEV